eukprot:16319188-Heterocapsa_arctica.AAC.1
MTMDCAFCANVERKEGCSTYGGNAKLATRSLITIGYSCKRSKSKWTRSHNVSGHQGSSVKYTQHRPIRSI